MTGRLHIAVAALLAAGTPCIAQIPVNDPSYSLGGRVDVRIAYKPLPGLTVTGGTEIRGYRLHLTDERLDLYCGAAWRFNPYLKAGAFYTFIDKREYRSDISHRHRISVYAAGRYKAGDWTLSAKETLQCTFKEDRNIYTTPACKVELKIKAGASRNLPGKWSMPLWVEGRILLDGPCVSGYSYDTSSMQYVNAQGESSGEPGWFLGGFHDAGLNRVRVATGLDRRMIHGNTLALTVYTDYNRDFRLQATRDGTRIKSMVYDIGVTTSICLRYTFALPAK